MFTDEAMFSRCLALLIGLARDRSRLDTSTACSAEFEEPQAKYPHADIHEFECPGVSIK